MISSPERASGQGLPEHGLVLGLVVVVGILALTQLGSGLDGIYDTLTVQLSLGGRATANSTIAAPPLPTLLPVSGSTPGSGASGDTPPAVNTNPLLAKGSSRSITLPNGKTIQAVIPDPTLMETLGPNGNTQALEAAVRQLVSEMSAQGGDPAQIAELETWANILHKTASNQKIGDHMIVTTLDKMRSGQTVSDTEFGQLYNQSNTLLAQSTNNQELFNRSYALTRGNPIEVNGQMLDIKTMPFEQLKSLISPLTTYEQDEIMKRRLNTTFGKQLELLGVIQTLESQAVGAVGESMDVARALWNYKQGAGSNISQYNQPWMTTRKTGNQTCDLSQGGVCHQ